MFKRIQSFLEELLGDVAFIDEHYALPGFHIFEVNGKDRNYDDVAGSAHFDLQWIHIIPDYVPDQTMSFTLLVEEPSGGASMEIWHARYRDKVELGFSARQYAKKYPPQIVRYTRGRLLVHDGLVLHAIGRSSLPNPRGLRVTLQGHGLRMPQGWMLYW